jgi:putative DNA primase/helicase
VEAATVTSIRQRFDGLVAQHSVEIETQRPKSSDYSDEKLARRFTDQHKENLKYVNKWGKWLVWDGQRWCLDDTLVVTDNARILVRETSEEILDRQGSQKLATVVASAKTVSAIERLARADRQHASQVDDWDRDPWLLNTPTGTVDLRTGQLRSA